MLNSHASVWTCANIDTPYERRMCSFVMTSDIDAINVKRKCLLAQALFESKPGEISTCDSCEHHVLSEHLHTYYGSMGREASVCPDCDLPEKWHTKYSKSRNMRYYVYFDPLIGSASRIVKWGHPTKGNPFHIPADHGECSDSFKRKRVD